jgi:CheY-like chemotaxis protein
MEQKKIIIIDDDPLNNFIIQYNIEHINRDLEITGFTNPVEGWKCIRELIIKKEKFILFLDINMPEISGWDLLENMDALDVCKGCEIYILSSSMDETDRTRAETNIHVNAYHTKPIQHGVLAKIIGAFQFSE